LKLLILAISLLVAFGLGEIMVRLFEPQQLILKRPDVWQPVDSLGWKHREGVSTTVNTGERTVELRTDSEGFRVGSAGRVEAPDQILILGDSFLEALQVEYEESIPGLLEARLPGRLDAAVAVRNAAVDGWDPRQYYVQARAALARSKYGLVVTFLYLGNDVISDDTYYFPPRAPEEVHRFRFPRSLASGELIDAILYPFNDALEVRSHLFNLLKKRFDSVLMRLGLTAAYFPTGFREQEADSPRWSVTADICEDIAAEAEARGIPLVFVLLPAPIQVEPGTLDRYARGFDIDLSQVDLEQPNRLLTEELRQRDLRVIDALPTLREARESGLKLYGEVDRHLSPSGHDVVARLIEDAVVEQLRPEIPAG
jgi:lysophospholipase L1-like esterase